MNIYQTLHDNRSRADYYYKICIAHKFKHARVGGAGDSTLGNVRIKEMKFAFLSKSLLCFCIVTSVRE